jgi:gas vesicle protein
MSTQEPNHIISISVKKFPQNLLIPNAENPISLEILNQSNKEEHFKFVFEGDNLDIEVKPTEFKDEVKFNPNETKTINLMLTPVRDGFGKLTINAYWMKLVEYIDKVQHIRKNISTSKINSILKNKQFLQRIEGDIFNINDYISPSNKNDTKKVEKQLKELIRIAVEPQPEDQSPGSETLRSDAHVVRGKIDEKLKMLAKSYISNGEFEKALETALKISVENERIELHNTLIRANALRNLDESLKTAENLKDPKKKKQIIKNIAFDRINVNPDEIPKILSLIEETTVRDNILLDILYGSLKKETSIALKLVEQIEDEIIKIKVLFNIIKKIHEEKKDDLILPILKQIDQIILNSDKIALSEHKYNNPAYEYFKETICILAELDCPETADKLIGDISSKELRENIAKDLFNELYEMVEEKKSKVEPIGQFSQFYVLNTYTSKISNEIETFSLVGGNVSNNALAGNLNFKIALISLFSYDFSIFPLIDRVYSELAYNSDKSIAYYIYPSISDHDEEEVRIIHHTLKRFVQPERITKQVRIFNLDFIPYLGKPTVILSSLSEDLKLIKSKIMGNLKDVVNVIIDEDLFKGGKTVDTLTSIFYGNNFKIVNLVLSYEFINDYNLFKNLVQSLT